MVSYADVAAMTNNGGNNWNNPMWLLWALMFGNGRFGNGNGCGIEINDRLNSLSQQIADNQNTNTISNAVSGNHEALHDLSAQMGLGFAGVKSAIDSASMTNVMGQKDAAAQMASCCCDIKTNILNQTNTLQYRIDQLANGITQGFSAVAYANQQQTNDLMNNANANTQRIVDMFNAHTNQELRDRLYEMSQQAQTASIVSQLKV